MSEIIFNIGGNSDISNRRERKGASLIAVLEDYTSLDLETTGLDPQFDDIIEISAIRVRNGLAVDSFHSLVNPGYEIDEFITELTGITNEMLSTAPAIETTFTKAITFIGNDVIVAHNANFDINFMYDTRIALLNTPFYNNFIDTMRMSRRLFPQLPHHRLKDVVQHLGVSASPNHRASTDAEAAYLCYESMKRYIQENGIDVAALSRKHRHVLKATDIVTDKVQFDESSPVFGKVFAFTGTLERMTRKEAMQIVVDMGGLCSDSVTQKTNYLVLGNNDYCKIKGQKSNKQRKAEQMKLSDHDIEILSEDAFYDMVSIK